MVGAVLSTRRILQGLIRNLANVVGALGLHVDLAPRTSGYQRLDDVAHEHGIPYRDFLRINDAEIVQAIKEFKPDLLFVVGLSQLVHDELLNVPRIGCVGFHPTQLPEGRGRAPLAWLILESRAGAATLFLMDRGADSGPILVQEPFPVQEGDYAGDVLEKVLDALDRALDRWVPQLIAGRLDAALQEESLATYYGRRAPSDGLIDWSRGSYEIYASVRAASRPHPGAYTYVTGKKLIVWRAEPEKEVPFHGVVGRILQIDDRGPLVQTGGGLLRLTEMEFPDAPPDSPAALNVGTRLGYSPQDEIHALRGRLETMESQIQMLQDALKRRNRGET